METESQQHMIPIVLGGALVAALAVAAVIYFIPSMDSTPEDLIAPTDQVALQTSGTGQFDTSLLQAPEYNALDASLFSRGLLPVAPPAGTGKTNLFQ